MKEKHLYNQMLHPSRKKLITGKKLSRADTKLNDFFINRCKYNNLKKFFKEPRRETLASHCLYSTY